MRYVLPLREGGSLPGLVEADDLGTYVVKFRGAGQGPKALVAEVVVGSWPRALGLPVPELVVVELDPRLAPAEPDQEVQDLLRASAGDNLGHGLPARRARPRRPPRDRVDADLAARVVWFDALTHNVDRSWRNPNLLLWHGEPWLIDHGAALYFHHNWAAPRRRGDPAVPAARPTTSCCRSPARWPSARPALAAGDRASCSARSWTLVPASGSSTPTDPADPAGGPAGVRRHPARPRRPRRHAWLDAVEVARAAAV